jgi:hypothetical protein
MKSDNTVYIPSAQTGTYKGKRLIAVETPKGKVFYCTDDLIDMIGHFTWEVSTNHRIRTKLGSKNLYIALNEEMITAPSKDEVIMLINVLGNRRWNDIDYTRYRKMLRIR